jgi:transcriptional regulator with XRE-family HTH domain
VDTPSVLTEEDAKLALKDAIGRRLAQLRTQQGLNVSELARKIGVSPSAISQIERGQARPSVATLFSLSRALDVPADAFFSDAPPEPPPSGPQPAKIPDEQPAAVGALHGEDPHRFVMRQAERPTLECSDGVVWQRLTSAALDGLEFLELVYAPHAESDSEVYRHRGFEFIVLTAGRMRITVGFEDHELVPGDSIAFPSWIPHRYVNPGDEQARAFTVIIDDLSHMPFAESSVVRTLGTIPRPVGSD